MFSIVLPDATNSRVLKEWAVLTSNLKSLLIIVSINKFGNKHINNF